MWVGSLAWKDPLEEGTATHSSILAWEPMDRGAWRAVVHRVAESQTCLKQLSTAYKAHSTSPYTEGSTALFILLPMLPCSNLIPWRKVLSPVQPLTPASILFSSRPLTLPAILLLFGSLRSLLLELGLQEKSLDPISHCSISGAWKLTSKPGNLSDSSVKRNACVSDSHSVVSASSNPMDRGPPGSSVHGLFPGKNTAVGCHFFLQGIFSTQGLNPGQSLHCLSHQGSL